MKKVRITSSQQNTTLFTLSIATKMIAIICIVFIALIQARLASYQAQQAPVTVDVPARGM